MAAPARQAADRPRFSHDHPEGRRRGPDLCRRALLHAAQIQPRPDRRRSRHPRRAARRDGDQPAGRALRPAGDPPRLGDLRRRPAISVRLRPFRGHRRRRLRRRRARTAQSADHPGGDRGRGARHPRRRRASLLAGRRPFHHLAADEGARGEVRAAGAGAVRRAPGHLGGRRPTLSHGTFIAPRRARGRHQSRHARSRSASAPMRQRIAASRSSPPTTCTGCRRTSSRSASARASARRRPTSPSTSTASTRRSRRAPARRSPAGFPRRRR